MKLFGKSGVIVAGLVVLVLGWRLIQGEIVQDPYLHYASSLGGGEFRIEYGNSRLFPGLPVILWFIGLFGVDLVMAGYAVMILSLLLSWLIGKRLTNNFDWLWLFFPPIMLDQYTQISTEGLMVMLMFLSLLLVKKRKYLEAGLVLGAGVWVRLAMLAMAMGMAVVLVRERKASQLSRLVAGVMVGVTGLLVYNRLMFGEGEWLYQLRVYQDVGRAELAMVQLVRDVFRAIDWGWYRILASGIIYLGFWAMVAVNLGRQKVKSQWQKMAVMSALFLSAFVFSVGPTPFLEEFSRFLVPVFALGGLFWSRWSQRKQAIVWFLVAVSVMVVVL